MNFKQGFEGRKGLHLMAGIEIFSEIHEAIIRR